MTTIPTTHTSSRRKRSLIGTAIVAAVAALSLGVGAGTANAGTVGQFAIGHVDAFFVSLNANSDTLQLGTNVDDVGYQSSWGYPVGYYYGNEVNAGSTPSTPDYTFTVPAAAYDPNVNAWVIPAKEPDFTSKPVLWAGFAGAGVDVADRNNPATTATYNLFNALSPADVVTLDLQVLSSAPGSVSIAGATGNGTATTPFAVSYPLVANAEAFHEHPQWTFSAAGTYYIQVQAHANGVNPSNVVTYEFDVQPHN